MSFGVLSSHHRLKYITRVWVFPLSWYMYLTARYHAYSRRVIERLCAALYFAQFQCFTDLWVPDSEKIISYPYTVINQLGKIIVHPDCTSENVCSAARGGTQNERRALQSQLRGASHHCKVHYLVHWAWHSERKRKKKNLIAHMKSACPGWLMCPPLSLCQGLCWS